MHFSLCIVLLCISLSAAYEIPQSSFETIRGDFFATTYELNYVIGESDLGFSFYHVTGPAVMLTVTATFDDGSVDTYQQNTSTSYTDHWFTWYLDSTAVNCTLTAEAINPLDIPSNEAFEYSIIQVYFDLADSPRPSAYPADHYWDKEINETACTYTMSFPKPDRAGTLSVYYVVDAFQDVFALLGCDLYGQLAGTMDAPVATEEIDMMDITVYNALSAEGAAVTGIYYGVVFESDDDELREVAYMAHDERSEFCMYNGVRPSLTYTDSNANCVPPPAWSCDAESSPVNGWIVILSVLETLAIFMLAMLLLRNFWFKKRRLMFEDYEMTVGYNGAAHELLETDSKQSSSLYSTM